MRRRGLLATAFLAFIMLGLPTGALGVAWPSIQAEFGLSLDALGWLLAAGTVGFLVASTGSGRLVDRLGLGAVLSLGQLLYWLGLLGQALAPGWLLLLFAALFVGLGGGLIDAGLNLYASVHGDVRVTNWLHACFGIGATLGPLVITQVLLASWSWRLGYGLLGLVQLPVLAAVLWTRARWPAPGNGAGPGTRSVPERPGDGTATAGHDGPSPRLRATLRLPLVWLGILLYFIYGGVEVTAGQWSYTLFTESRAVTTAVAGRWVSIYWGSLTAGRFLLGWAVTRVGVRRMLRWSMASASLGCLLLWYNGAPVVSFWGLALIGFALAPIFPSLITTTPQRVGPRHVANTVGFQIGATSLGIAFLPGLAGALAERLGLEVIGPFLLVIALAMLLCHEALYPGGD